MKYTEEMILHSDSGYCMPFEEPQGKDVEMSLGYGEQVHPATGEKLHNLAFRGMDTSTGSALILLPVATS